MHTRSPTTPAGAGPLLRDWRARRRRSQLDLALQVGVSTRHLSFIETGRARPSAPMLLALAVALEVPLRERNRLLLAAGHAPRFEERPLEAADLAPVRAALRRVLDAHDPYPGVVLDRHWNVVDANRAAQALASTLPASLTAPVLNVFRAGLHPEGLAARTLNFDEWGAYLVQQLQRLAAWTGDPGLLAIEREVADYPNVRSLPDPTATAGPAPLLVPFVLAVPGGRIAMFTTLTVLATPLDVTLDELRIELFYPADAGSEQLLRSAPGASRDAPAPAVVSA